MFFVHASITFPASDTNAPPRIIDAGFYTVDLFFALSAYLLTQLLVRELARRGKANVRAFYLRRLLRIWPLYFFFLGLAFILSNAFMGSPYASSFTARSAYFVAYLFFVGNFANGRMGPPMVILSPLWTICTEEQVYLVLPWLIRKATPLGIAAAGAALVVAANFTRVEFAFHYSSGVPVWFNTLTHLDSIGIGILLAAVPREWFSGLTRSRRIASVAIGTQLGIALDLSSHKGSAIEGESLLYVLDSEFYYAASDSAAAESTGPEAVLSISPTVNTGGIVSVADTDNLPPRGWVRNGRRTS